VLLFLPFLSTYADRVVEFGGSPGLAVAWAQLIFNVVMTVAVLVLLRLFEKQLARYDADAPG